MNNNSVIFTQRAFNAIVTETISMHPVETGGILLGYILDNGMWIVVENVSPGYNSIHQNAYYEYDEVFVTYLANKLIKQYKGNVKVLGLWHRHPMGIDVFSNIDIETNNIFARKTPVGAISALVNCDPQLRMSMYHVDDKGNSQPINWIVDDGHMIPEHYLALRYKDESELPVFDSNGVVNNPSTRRYEPFLVPNTEPDEERYHEFTEKKDAENEIVDPQLIRDTNSKMDDHNDIGDNKQHSEPRAWTSIKKIINYLFFNQ